MREFWIEFEGDPNQDAENYKRYVCGTKFKPIDFNHEIIHVRTVSPEIDAAVARMIKALESHSNCDTCHKILSAYREATRDESSAGI